MDRHARPAGHWAAHEIRFHLGHASAMATARWLAAAPTRPPPAHWNITHAAQICDYEYPELGKGMEKRVYKARTLAGKQPVIVKITKNEFNNSDMYSPYPGLTYRNDWANELMYLEYLRGQPGVPHLLGGWRNESSAAIVLHDAGARSIHKAGNTSDEYVALARSRPIALARAILECFRTFSEWGGFMSLDWSTPIRNRCHTGWSHSIPIDRWPRTVFRAHCKPVNPPTNNRHGPQRLPARAGIKLHRQLVPAVVAFALLLRSRNATAAFIGGEVRCGT